MAPSPDSYHPNWHVRAITAPGPDSDLTLHVSFDNARFLFGCGEGTQRAYNQKRLTLKGLSGIFVGSGDAKGRSGLAGVLMTAADAGISKVGIVGPPDISHYLSTLRSSVIRDSLNIQMSAYPRNASTGEVVEMFKSPNITVSSLALTPQPIAGPSTTPYDVFDPHSSAFRPSRLSPVDAQKWCDAIVGDMFHNGPKARASRRPHSPRGSPNRPANPFVNPDGTLCTSLPDTRYPLPVPSREEVETQMVYFCHTPDVRGKFNVEMANKLGVPKGPIRGKLTRGEAIEVDDPGVEGGKRIVKPEDCLIGGGPGSIMIVVNCTTQTKSALLESPAFAKYQHSDIEGRGEGLHRAHLIVHKVTSSVWRSEEYQSWMSAFGDRTQHLIAETEEYPDRTVFNSAAWNTLQLSLLDPQVFSPPFVTAPHLPSTSLPPNTSLLTEGSYCRMHPPADVTTLPHHEKDIPFLYTHSDAEEARAKIRQDMPEYAQAVDAAREAVSSDPRTTGSSTPRPGDDITVTTLGTGSAIPSKYRNVSSTHLDIPGVGGIMLDAGEGTLGQMRRKFGKAGLKTLFEELRMVFISHMHADHHLGLTAVLEDRFRVSHLECTVMYSERCLKLIPCDPSIASLQHGISSPLFVIAPSNIALHMQETEQNLCEALELTFGSSYRSADQTRDLNRLLKDLDLASIWAPTVPHRGRAYGFALEHTSGWKIVYSGDTKPANILVEAGRDATLLIHEATLEDDKPEVAAHKGHSTFSQAIDIGKEMNARHILLNHFSQRYPKLPKLPEPVPEEDGSTTAQPVVSISFDFMSIRVKDMWKMAHYMEPMSMLFAEAEEEGEGEDSTLGAVKGDINPSVDGGAHVQVNGGGKSNKSKSEKKSGKNDKQKSKDNTDHNRKHISNNESAQSNGQGVQGTKQDIKVIKKTAALEYLAAGSTTTTTTTLEQEQGSGQAKRAGSPSMIQPEAKRRSTDSSAGQAEGGEGEGLDDKLDVC
ncbi:hypothetical protein I316_02722 [Kwoniella heveanensis BCC8398]|uniref:ribonuclease Z n=1 Tax=Kwoniella heveanensis BCC8398 TaxID=1296120 RepID=A0A1B9GXB3_9TREE|nr:hypothetical protein I316_02722 [Kwoniella heveanensis BCC8398]